MAVVVKLVFVVFVVLLRVTLAVVRFAVWLFNGDIVGVVVFSVAKVLLSAVRFVVVLNRSLKGEAVVVTVVFS